MHLSQCVDLFSLSSNFDHYELKSCVSGWLFKSTTEFYGWDDRLHLNVMFGVLCWGYSLAGIMMFFVKPSWTKKSNFPYVLFGLILTFVQGPLSFLADYKSMTHDSFIHVIDRFMAIINLFIQIWKVSALFYYARPGTFYFQLCAITFAIFCFMNSQYYQETHDPEGFIFWHNCWHLYPFIGIGIESFDYFYLGEYDTTTLETVSPVDEKIALRSLWRNLKYSTLFPNAVELDVVHGEEDKKLQ